MKRRNHAWQFPPEVEAVLKASPNLKPCKRKYGRVPYDRFIEHIRRDGCVQCLELFLQLDKEMRMMEYLRAHKN
ncbi:MAG: hypothetical protein WA715_10610 [Candidatus Acidiferrum sp.]